MLWDRGKTLVKQKLEAVVVHAHHKLPALEIRPPMAHRLDKTDKHPLIGGKFAVSRRDLSAEEGDRPALLMQHRPKSRPRCITLHDEGL